MDQSCNSNSRFATKEWMMAKLYVKIQPKASKTEYVGRLGEMYKIRIQSAPVKGAANKELIKFIGKTLGISKSAIRIKSGHTSRQKTLEIDGVSDDDIKQKFE